MRVLAVLKRVRLPFPPQTVICRAAWVKVTPTSQTLMLSQLLQFVALSAAPNICLLYWPMPNFGIGRCQILARREFFLYKQMPSMHKVTVRLRQGGRSDGSDATKASRLELDLFFE